MERLARPLRWAGLTALILLTYHVITMSPGTWDLIRLMWTRWVQQGYFGVGVWDGVPNGADFSLVEPGDILLGHNPGSSWGHFTHAALYVGDGKIVESFLNGGGVHLEPVSRYHYYTRVAILKVEVPREVKERAVQLALSRRGRPFYLLARRESGNWMYCTQLVWWAYKQAGVDLDPDGGFWVVPDRFLKSPFVRRMDPPQRLG